MNIDLIVQRIKTILLEQVEESEKENSEAWRLKIFEDLELLFVENHNLLYQDVYFYLGGTYDHSNNSFGNEETGRIRAAVIGALTSINNPSQPLLNDLKKFAMQINSSYGDPLLRWCTEQTEKNPRGKKATPPPPPTPTPTPVVPPLKNFIITKHDDALVERDELQKKSDNVSATLSWGGKLLGDKNFNIIQKQLKDAENDLRRWTKAKAAYDIEHANVEVQQQRINELSGLEGLTPEQTAEKARAEASLKESQRAIQSLERSFGDSSSLGKTSTLVLKRGDNLMGFHSQVVERAEIETVFKTLNIDPASSDGNVSVSTKDDVDSDLYYLNTPVKDTEVIVTTKAYDAGDKACIIQSKNSVVDRSNFSTSSPQQARDEVAIETAFMFILNRGKGTSIVLRGSDEAQIRKVHATLLWMKHLPPDDLKTICSDWLNGDLSKKSNLDISKLEIISRVPPPVGSMFRGQRSQDDAFIQEHMPGLNQKHLGGLFKSRLSEIRNEQKKLQNPKDLKEIIGPAVNTTPRSGG